MGAIGLAYSLSGAAGIRTSWVMLIVSCAVRWGFLNPPDSLAWVGSGWIIFLSLVASLVFFMGDKVPALDHLLHGVHFVLAPLVGGLTAMTGFHGDPVISIALGALGAGNALFLHSARTGLRVVSSGVTMGIANPIISLIEDVMAAVFILIALFAPVLTAVAMVMATVWMVKKVNRWRTA